MTTEHMVMAAFVYTVFGYIFAMTIWAYMCAMGRLVKRLACDVAMEEYEKNKFVPPDFSRCGGDRW